MVNIHMPPWSENVKSTLDYQQFTFSANCDKKRRKGYEVEEKKQISTWFLLKQWYKDF